MFSKIDLAKLIFPLMVELLLTLLVGMIDSIMVSSAGESAVSGVSLIDTVFQLLIYIFAAFGTGGSVVAGQYLGAKKDQQARETVDQLVWFSLLSSLVIMVIIFLIRNFLLTHVFGSISQEVFFNANRYLIIVALSIPALSIYESGAAVFRTMGNAKKPMFLSMIMNVVNVCGNAILIYVFQMGTAGAAIATVISRYVAVLIMTNLLVQTDQPLYLTKSLRYVPKKEYIGHILGIGLPNGIENGLFQLGKIILAGLVAKFGTSAITANAICQTIANLQMIPGSAIALAATPVIARCVGAKEYGQAKYYNRLLLMLTFVSLIVFCGIFWMALSTILSWYHLSMNTATLTTQMVLVHTIGALLIWPFAFVTPSSMRASGDVRFAMITSVISMFVFRIGTAYIFSLSLHMEALGVWVAMLCDWGFRAIVFSIRWIQGGWTNKGIVRA